MARRGSFGRVPRTASSLTSTIVAIAREFQNQRAQNIMDAWQKGGLFEGEKATDAKVLAFWREKAKGVDKNDPLYDQYKNAATQLDYTIHESKMTAKYAQGKASDGAMVDFYLNWAKKVPKNSEFYRVLQRDAGQYMRNQKARSQADARQAAESRYQTQQANTQRQKEAAGEYTIDTLRRLAQSGYANGGIAPAISAPGSGSDLTDFDPSDPNLMMRLIAAISPEKTVTRLSPGDIAYESSTGKFEGNKDVIFHDDDGRPVTGQDILERLGKLDPSFKPGVPFNVNYVTGLLDRQMQGLNERIERAKKTGHMTDVVSLQKSKSYVALLNREVAAYPIQKAYQEARADYDAVVADKSASPQAVLKAWNEYSSTLTHLSKDPRIEADDNFRSRLIAEVNGTDGVPTLNESFTGLSNSQYDAQSAKDAAENKAGIEFMQAQVDAVASGSALWTYGEKDSNGVFVPKAGGREIGAATPEAIQGGGANVQVVTVADPRGGAPLQMAVTAIPVYASATNPATGEPLSPTNGNPIAYAYDFPKGSGTATQYGFQTKQGFVFSSDPPWDEQNLSVKASAKGGNHLEVDLTPVVAKQFFGARDPFTGTFAPGSLDLKTNASLPGGFAVQGATLSRTGKQDGQLTFDPQTAVWSTDTRDMAGLDPQSDFSSLTLATLMSDEEGRTILTNLDKNPAFAATIQSDNFRASGYQRDATGSWVPGQNADPSKLAGLSVQQSVAANARSFSDFIAEAAGLWQRETTGSPYKPTSAALKPLPSEEVRTALPSESLRGTSFDALSSVFNPGTSTIKQPGKAADDRFVINPGTSIKVPALPTPSVAPAPSPSLTKPTVAAPAPPTQVGSTAPVGGSLPPGTPGPRGDKLKYY